MGCSFHKWGCFTDLQTGILGQCPVNARPHSAVYGHRLGNRLRWTIRNVKNNWHPLAKRKNYGIYVSVSSFLDMSGI